jgi:hypothetical protein
MTIRTTYGNDPLQRKLDQAYELAGLASQDGDKVDEARWMREVERLKEEIRSTR